MDPQLVSWNDGPTKSAITDFVGRVTEEGGSDYVEPAARVAVFDNDGTLWTEKPLVIQLDFTIRRFREIAESDPRGQWTSSMTAPKSPFASGAASVAGPFLRSGIRLHGRGGAGVGNR